MQDEHRPHHVTTDRTANTGQAFKAPQRSLQSKIVWALIWLPLKLGNAWISTQVGGQKRPVFFSVEETFPDLLELEKNFDVIRQELEGILPERDGVPSYHELDPMQARISGSNDPNAHWKVFLFYAMGEKPAENREKCPRTAELLDKIPNITQSFLSILEGGKSVPAHCGPYRGFLRYHLALKVPKQDTHACVSKTNGLAGGKGRGSYLTTRGSTKWLTTVSIFESCRWLMCGGRYEECFKWLTGGSFGCSDISTQKR